MTAAANGASRGTPGTRLDLEVTELKRALAMVAPAVAGRTSIPAMQHVLIAGGMLTATDGELRIETKLHGAEESGITVLLPGDKLTRIAGACDRDGDIRIEQGKAACTVKSKTGKWVLPTCAVSDFPASAPGRLLPVARVPGDQLARCLETVIPAADKRGGGVLINVTDGVVTFVATDGRRLHAYRIEIDQAVDDCEVLITVRAANAIHSIAVAAGFEAVQLASSKASIVATNATTTLTAARLASAFPAWRKAIPEESDAPTRVQAGHLLAATRAAGITTSQTSRGVAYAITSEGILLTGKSPEAGESKVACDISECGTPCQITLAPEYVAQFLETVESLEMVHIEAKSAESNVVLRCEDRLCVISPIAA
jgi:DNA polymerase-3 subunit beta